MFYSWPEVKFWCLTLGVFAFGLAIFRRVRAMRLVIRIPAQITGVVTSLLSFAVMSLVLLGYVSGCSSDKEPLLSPSGRKAARITIHDEGGTGGGASVYVYSQHGFSVKRVMSGGWQSVWQSDLRWIDDSTLEIKYAGDESNCVDTRDVHVVCIQKPDYHR